MRERNKTNDKNMGVKGRVDQVSPLSPLPALLPPVQQAWAQVGGRAATDKKTKAACSNRLLPKGCYGNSGRRGTSYPQ